MPSRASNALLMVDSSWLADIGISLRRNGRVGRLFRDLARWSQGSAVALYPCRPCESRDPLPQDWWGEERRYSQPARHINHAVWVLDRRSASPRLSRMTA